MINKSDVNIKDIYFMFHLLNKSRCMYQHALDVVVFSIAPSIYITSYTHRGGMSSYVGNYLYLLVTDLAKY